MVYFDNNATTPLAEVARSAWLEAADEAWANPSSPYRASARVRNLLESCRERMAALIGCGPEEIVFNSGATEANNAVFGYLARHAEDSQSVVVSAVEHPSVIEPANKVFPNRVIFAANDSAGVVDPDELRSLLRKRAPAAVSVMAANNETGVIQDFESLADICREHGVWFHCDAAQWIGKMPSAQLGGCGLVTGSAHKFGGPKGVGFLRIPSAMNGFQGQSGGEQEGGRRAGTENYPGIAAMLAALEEREAAGFDDLDGRVALREQFEARLLEEVPGARILGAGERRLWNTVSIILPRYDNYRWVVKLDHEGFAVSTGSACSSGDEAPSHVLAAMDRTGEEARRVVRVSAGPETSDGDWAALAMAFGRVWRRWDEGRSDSSLTEVVSI